LVTVYNFYFFTKKEIERKRKENRERKKNAITAKT